MWRWIGNSYTVVVPESHTTSDPMGLYLIADIDSESDGVSSWPLTRPERIPTKLIGLDIPYTAQAQVGGADATI